MILYTQTPDFYNDYICHYGVKGMKWGKRKAGDPGFIDFSHYGSKMDPEVKKKLEEKKKAEEEAKKKSAGSGSSSSSSSSKKSGSSGKSSSGSKKKAGNSKSSGSGKKTASEKKEKAAKEPKEAKEKAAKEPKETKEKATKESQPAMTPVRKIIDRTKPTPEEEPEERSYILPPGRFSGKQERVKQIIEMLRKRK